MDESSVTQPVVKVAVQQIITSIHKDYQHAFDHNKKYLEHHVQTIDKLLKNLKEATSRAEERHSLIGEVLEQVKATVEGKLQTMKKSKRIQRIQKKLNAEKSILYPGSLNYLNCLLLFFDSSFKALQKILSQLRHFDLSHAKKFKKLCDRRIQEMQQTKHQLLSQYKQLSQKFYPSQRECVVVNLLGVPMHSQKVIQLVVQYGVCFNNFRNEAKNLQKNLNFNLKLFLQELAKSFIDYNQEFAKPLKEAANHIEDQIDCQLSYSLQSIICSEVSSLMLSIAKEEGSFPTQEVVKNYLNLAHRVDFIQEYDTARLLLRRYAVQYDEGIFTTWKQGFFFISCDYKLILLDQMQNAVVWVQRSKGVLEVEGERTVRIGETKRSFLPLKSKSVRVKLQSADHVEEVQFYFNKGLQ